MTFTRERPRVGGRAQISHIGFMSNDTFTPTKTKAHQRAEEELRALRRDPRRAEVERLIREISWRDAFKRDRPSNELTALMAERETSDARVAAAQQALVPLRAAYDKQVDGAVRKLLDDLDGRFGETIGVVQEILRLRGARNFMPAELALGQLLRCRDRIEAARTQVHA